MIGKKVLFLDRDGIINKMVLQKSGVFDSPQNTREVELVPGISEVIGWLNKNKISVIEISNQPGVAKGKMNMETLEAIEKRVHDLLKEKKVCIDKTYRCFHDSKENCYCRKPNPGLLLQAVEDLDIDLLNSAILGDNTSDMEAGMKVGVKTIHYFHENDVSYKVELNRKYKADFRVYNHHEVIPVLIKLFL